MHRRNFVMRFFVVAALIGSLAYAGDTVSMSNFLKYDRLRQEQVDLATARGTAYSNKAALAMSYVQIMSNQVRQAKREAMVASVKAVVIEVVFAGVMTYLLGKYITK